MKPKFRGYWLVLAGAVLLGLGWLYALPVMDFIGEISIREIEQTVQSWGMWGVFASIGLMVIHSFVPFPAEFIAMANGIIYGPLWGTLITWVGAMLGALAAFGLSRIVGRRFVEAMVARRNWHMLDEWASQSGGYFVFVGRFIPLISFNMINYAAGLTAMPWWTFCLATGVGIIPMTVLMVVMGDQIETISWQIWLAVTAAVIILLVLVHQCRARIGNN